MANGETGGSHGLEDGREGRDGLLGWTWPTRIDGGGEVSFLKLG